MTIIEQIKAEIERLYGKYETKYHETRLPYVEGLLDGFGLVEQFLSTLESEKPVPNDLEEAAWDCVLDSVDVNNPVLLSKYKELLTYLFIAGANWQKKQLMKETGRISKPELTWEDIAKIDALILEANNEFAVDYSKEIRRKQFYTEVLNRFNKSKEEK